VLFHFLFMVFYAYGTGTTDLKRLTVLRCNSIVVGYPKVPRHRYCFATAIICFSFLRKRVPVRNENKKTTRKCHWVWTQSQLLTGIIYSAAVIILWENPFHNWNLPCNCCRGAFNRHYSAAALISWENPFQNWNLPCGCCRGDQSGGDESSRPGSRSS
jgi:hypothetical protein